MWYLCLRGLMGTGYIVIVLENILSIPHYKIELDIIHIHVESTTGYFYGVFQGLMLTVMPSVIIEYKEIWAFEHTAGRHIDLLC